MIRTYKYKLLPSKSQRLILVEILEQQRQLWNAALEERISYYSRTGKTKSFFDQCNALTVCRRENPEMKLLPNNLQRGTLKRLNTSYQLFFSNVKKNVKVSLPRFRGFGSFDCISFDTWNGVRLVNKRLAFKGINPLRLHWHRELPQGKPKSCQIFRRVNGWFICFQMEVDAQPMCQTNKSCGIDLGIENHLTFDDGSIIELERFNVLERRKKKMQRRLSRCKRGSNNRRKAKNALARASLKIKNARSTRLRQIVSDLYNRYDIIAVEKLNTKKMLNKDNNKSLNRSLSSAIFGLFTKYLTEKAESAARELILVDPSYTSQTCPKCQDVNPKSLSERKHKCNKCGYETHRDHAAAQVIMQRAAA